MSLRFQGHRKAPEDWRSPKAGARSNRPREASWTAPVLWRFGKGASDLAISSRSPRHPRSVVHSKRARTPARQTARKRRVRAVPAPGLHLETFERAHVLGAFEGARIGAFLLAHRAAHLLDGFVFVLRHPFFQLFGDDLDLVDALLQEHRADHGDIGAMV